MMKGSKETQLEHWTDLISAFESLNYLLRSQQLCTTWVISEGVANDSNPCKVFNHSDTLECITLLCPPLEFLVSRPGVELRICIGNKFSDDADTVDLGNTIPVLWIPKV